MRKFETIIPCLLCFYVLLSALLPVYAEMNEEQQVYVPPKYKLEKEQMTLKFEPQTEENEIEETIPESETEELIIEEMETETEIPLISIQQTEATTTYYGFKSWMDYRKITSTSSPQYKLQTFAETDPNGLRTVDGRFCVAMGSYWGLRIGQYFDLILEDGTIIPCILGDEKSDIHTDNENIVTLSNGCMSEFLIDIDKLAQPIRITGDVSSINNWKSKVVNIVKYEIYKL